MAAIFPTGPNVPGGSSNPYSGRSSSVRKAPSAQAGMTFTRSVGGGGVPRTDPNPEFTTRPFVAGSLTGIRCWQVDSLGRLTPVNDWPDSVWTPGENIATCHQQWSINQAYMMYSPVPSAQWVNAHGTITAAGAMQMMHGMSKSLNAGDTFKLDIPQVSEHDVSTMDCTCGFYGYFDNLDNPYFRTGNLHGIVEGYGVMTVGDRGFRASKAKIKALVIPAVRAASWMQVARNYDGIPIFTELGDALELYPLSLPSDVPNPDNTPDFWTRKA